MEEQWKARSSRVVSICLKMGEGLGGTLCEVSYYAPTRAARRKVKMPIFRSLTIFLQMYHQERSTLCLVNSMRVLGQGNMWVISGMQ